MSKIRMWTLGSALALLASADWFVASAPAGGGAGGKPSIKVGKADVTVRIGSVEVKERMEWHAFLETQGVCRGTLKVRFQETPFNPMGRMIPLPKTVWERELPIATQGPASIDLGVVPAAEDKVLRDVMASTDGKTFVRLHRYGGGELAKAFDDEKALDE